MIYRDGIGRRHVVRFRFLPLLRNYDLTIGTALVMWSGTGFCHFCGIVIYRGGISRRYFVWYGFCQYCGIMIQGGRISRRHVVRYSFLLILRNYDLSERHQQTTCGQVQFFLLILRNYDLWGRNMSSMFLLFLRIYDKSGRIGRRHLVRYRFCQFCRIIIHRGALVSYVDCKRVVHRSFRPDKHGLKVSTEAKQRRVFLTKGTKGRRHVVRFRFLPILQNYDLSGRIGRRAVQVQYRSFCKCCFAEVPRFFSTKGMFAENAQSRPPDLLYISKPLVIIKDFLLK